MDIELFERWKSAILESRYNNKDQIALLEYVSNILQRNGIIIINAAHLAQLVGVDENVMNSMIITPEHFYRSFSIPKRSGGERVLSAPYPSLMMIQRWIYANLLLPHIELSDSAIGFIPGKSIVDNAYPHIGSAEVLKMDIKDFFPSIDIKRVITVFKGLGYYHRVAYYLACLCCKDDCLPQGAPTSPILSNIIAKRLDKRLKGLADKFHLQYTRYADDLTFSGEHIPVKFISFVTDIVKAEGFKVNDEKTRIMRKHCRKIITGVSISSGKPCIPRAKKRWIRQQMYYIDRFGIKSHLKHLRVVDPLYALKMNGYISYWKSVEPYNNYIHNI